MATTTMGRFRRLKALVSGVHCSRSSSRIDPDSFAARSFSSGSAFFSGSRRSSSAAQWISRSFATAPAFVGRTRRSSWSSREDPSAGEYCRVGFKRLFAKKAAPTKLSRGAKGAAKAKKTKEALAHQAAKGKKGAARTKGATATAAGSGGGDAGHYVNESEGWTPREPEELVEDELFTGTRGLLDITADDINKYFYVSRDDASKYFAEGFPKSLVKEFTSSGGSFIRLRAPAFELCQTLNETQAERKHYILDGPVGCGKSFTLAVIVQWARAHGWLVFYVPNAKSWTRGGYYYLNEDTGFWDTPLQAETVLQGFLDSHADMLETIKCRVTEAIPLGEAAGLGRQPGEQTVTMPEGASLRDLVEMGIKMQTAASNIVMRLRQELDLVTEYPVLIAVDEYNSWFNLSEYFQFVDFRKRRHIHSRELGMVNAFRKMAGTPTFFIGAFSQSTGVGKLPLDLPGAPRMARIPVERFTKDEVKATLDYYYRQKMIHSEPSDDTVDRIFYLTNGNGSEIRKLGSLL